jgi:hypothetical protein
MKKCWKCGKIEYKKFEVGNHHINGNDSDNSLRNLINLCPKCHDLVQGICDKCQNQPDCSIKKLQQCWGFDDALPPIHFRRRKDMDMEALTDAPSSAKTSPSGRNKAKTGISKDALGCKCMLGIYGKELIYTCLRLNEPKRGIYPCKHFMKVEGLCLFNAKSAV